MVVEEGIQSDRSSSNQDTLKSFSYTNEYGPNFIDDADKAYIVLLNVFHYLSTKDLMSVRRVCKVWNLVGSDNIFWKKVDLRNCRVQPDMIVRTLKKYGTEILDLRGLILSLEILSNLCQALTEVTSLTEIIMKHCDIAAVPLLAKAIPHLKSLSIYHVDTNAFPKYHYSYLDITPFKNMKALKTLQLVNKGQIELIFNSCSTDIIELNLTTLTITRSRNLSCIEHILPSTLVSLELGDCCSLSYSFCDVILPKLINLTRLRLVKCYDDNLTTKLIKKICELPNLSELELVNFNFSTNFEKGLAKCNLRSLLIIPWYESMRAFLHPYINQSILFWVSTLKNSLRVFIWVVSNYMLSIQFRNSLDDSSNIGVTAQVPNIPVKISDGGLVLIPFDEIQSKLWPDLKFKIFRVRFYFTWNLSLHCYEDALIQHY